MPFNFETVLKDSVEYYTYLAVDYRASRKLLREEAPATPAESEDLHSGI